ncbi:MAG: M20/M25/M40 family metallo-hydrolase [Acidimicrobiales bacterium]|nr:M20/M25/M40 family metallo-hydrolase [Acidimicrobiales bacterium]HRW37549.1 M20/M25/M40 family metallo-hydrolase [Aquihabitans sp.]
MEDLDLSIVDDRTTELWSGLVPVLSDYIAIPALSPGFDADWAENGHLDRAVELIVAWCEDRPIPGLTVSVHRLEGRTPVITCEIPATSGAEAAPPVLLYGHLDKQPEMEGWRDDLGPWQPVLEGDRLYGRGGADDGYAPFAALGALEAVQASGGAHPRCVVLIEASEESGSPDLPAYVEALADVIGTPQLIVCLDSGAADYEHLWLTTSLRGMAAGNLTVRVVEEGLHSGGYGGFVPDGFRILRRLLDRIEDSEDGRVLLPSAWVEVPPETEAALERATSRVGAGRVAEAPLTPGVDPVTGDDPLEAMLATTWRPQLTVVGQDGLPPSARAGNVLRPETTLRLSLRIPPHVDPDVVLAELEAALTEDPPHGAQVTFSDGAGAWGWAAPPTAPWLEAALQRASDRFFGAPALHFGEGGTIPFMAMLGERFPGTQFVVTGVLGPHSNAHGPNEFLHLPTGRRITAAVAVVLHAAAARR